MLMKRARIVLLAGLVLASAPVALRAFEDKAPDDKKPEKLADPKDKGAVVAVPGPGCGSSTQTVYVNEWVPEQYETTRTTYKTEWREEAYTAYKTEYVKENRTRTVCCTTSVPTWEERTVCKWISVPCVETRTVMKKVEVCKPVTVHHRKLVCLGHYECQEVQPLFAKHGCGHSCGGCGDSCGGCATACPRTRKVWKYCPQYEDCCETKMVKCWECVPTTCQVTVCKKVAVQEKCKVCVNKCVTTQKEEVYTVCVPKCVAVQCTRKVAHCVPCTEKVTCCRMVCRQVAKQVTCASPCDTCDSGCGHKCHRSFFRSRSCGAGCGCNTGCGGCN